MNPTRPSIALLLLSLAIGAGAAGADEEGPPDAGAALPYAVVDTGQERCYDARREIAYPKPGEAFFGQDAHYVGREPRYEDRGDGTVLDRVTGLMWQRAHGPKRTFVEAVAGAALCRTAGHRDWRLPTIKELYSLILFSGLDVDPHAATSGEARPFLDTRFFDFAYGDPARGERIIDSQWATATPYVHTSMHGHETVFGVNFADGRIKGYGLRRPRGGGDKTFFVRYVRGNPRYGKNDFHDNQDGTITDRATGLVWTKQDSGHLGAGPSGDGRLSWEQALAFAEGLELAGQTDWRLPDAKELQSLVDYSRSPDTTGSAAIDPVFEVSSIRAEGGEKDYPYYWTSTTHASRRGGSAAVYFAFGRAGGWMRRPGGPGDAQLLDVHGAGAQRSDPKEGDPRAFPRGRGPQGDVVRILNHVRLVRGGVTRVREAGPALLPVAPDPGRGGARFVERLDRDGDGKVSRGEFDGPPEHFDHLDRNGDGFLDADEAPRGPPPGPLPPGREPRGR